MLAFDIFKWELFFFHFIQIYANITFNKHIIQQHRTTRLVKLQISLKTTFIIFIRYPFTVTVL